MAGCRRWLGLRRALVVGLVVVVLVARVGVAAAGADDDDDVDGNQCQNVTFKHGNVRCKCTCPVVATTLNSTEGLKASSCDVSRKNYDAGDKTVCGKETCVSCINDRVTKTERECSYTIVVSDESQCSCQNVMPSNQGPNVTDATASMCDLCTCTYEARNTHLIKGTVISFMVVASLLVLVACINALPRRRQMPLVLMPRLSKPAPFLSLGLFFKIWWVSFDSIHIEMLFMYCRRRDCPETDDAVQNVEQTHTLAIIAKRRDELCRYAREDPRLATATLLTYVDLSEAKNWRSLDIRHHERLRLVYLVGRMGLKKPLEVIIPALADRDLQLQTMHQYYTEITDPNSELNTPIQSFVLGIMADDSTVVYYRFSQGLQAPPESLIMQATADDD
ncbi:uncharacterized protein MONBRDRAFT_26992 [Monosiga brevicollis MX1]|uniref:tRNA-splicing endonuclease subunit Sen15 domain-containing protein n=1 Tax=Monosiga brevicollis TaxID=81824 RepID=A9V3J1_MONBE|nr:uncharacterized protein MONBRDRAFT_26992 [Monosiga brevicollis MX1]EDQ87822.1 predicted protein [Monosiga brevicollis MX1]|eukprot:XP_001747355.1 hypothetical protein [Monosiga brevicollis MX1]